MCGERMRPEAIKPLSQACLVPEAFVLVKTEPSHERDVYLALTSHEAVKEVHALYGEFDLLAHVSSDSAKNLTSLLMKEFK